MAAALNSNRGILCVNSHNFAELVRCVSTLRGMIEGRDSNSIQLAKFDVVPHHVQNQLSAKEEVVAS
ncbi:hypothetical protein LguiA_034180 [Lonicera macranthoides]